MISISAAGADAEMKVADDEEDVGVPSVRYAAPA